MKKGGFTPTSTILEVVDAGSELLHRFDEWSDQQAVVQLVVFFLRQKTKTPHEFHLSEHHDVTERIPRVSQARGVAGLGPWGLALQTHPQNVR